MTRFTASARHRSGFVAPFLLLALFALLPSPGGAGTSLLGLPRLCLVRNATRIPCPGCGMTRALVCSAHGQWRQAAAFHPLGPVTFLGLAGLVLWRLAGAAWPGLRFALPPRLVSGIALAGLAVLLAVWVARLAGALPLPP